MLGAATGDIIGSRFEFDNHKSTDFELFTDDCGFTDDTVCTAAVADWVAGGCRNDLALLMQQWCRRYPAPRGAYGASFQRWIHQHPPQPYGSWGNGSAMRASAVGWAFDTLDETLAYAEASAAITHNHPEGIKGAQAVAATIFWSRHGCDKAFIRNNITNMFGYRLNRSCRDIRPDYTFDASCAGSVPQAFAAFFDSNHFEHAVRLAVSLGGDSDTLAAITGSIAEAYYGGVPSLIREQTLKRLPPDITRALLSVPM
ncbi:ADP-ribosylglycohydrolase family protein [Neisseria sp. 74A18]|uniref:ADP-ribosylglycohydrolase family protein n=1 Tax=Neisseria sp. 74A18 TaxID=1696094 RepID=UPI0006CAEDED|nr:ADP-ribosylglycohydrolase family protein [Neisseria sp. 74A18]KPN74341.1 ADP-ribosylglycohydrolase [Neisseria sp. 74A18]